MNRTDSDVDLQTLLSQAEKDAREGKTSSARAMFSTILDNAPTDPRLLNTFGNRAMSVGMPDYACQFLERAADGDPDAAPIWLNLAMAKRLVGDDPGELKALDRALTLDPYLLVALLKKAEWFERCDRFEDAVRTYRALLSAAPPVENQPEALRSALQHGRALVDRENARIEEALAEALDGETERSQRFDHCLEMLVGRRKLYLPQPAGLHFSYLPAVPFFDRDQFPWFETLENGVDVIREEIMGARREGLAGEPYIRIAPGQPVNQWNALNFSLDWGAVFLWKDGMPIEDASRRFPKTAELLAQLPLLDIPGRGPTAMFSALRPGAHIPPHHGVTNTRVVVHLPLIVPDGCSFRVGSETRAWKEGVAWAFDDTIEHEAWNRSDADRVILIVDAWNPYLTEDERRLLRAASGALQTFGDG